MQEAGTASGSFGYAGEQLDAVSELVFLRARYYDPKTGRFLTRNLYPAYASARGARRQAGPAADLGGHN